jgi:hypothetical protein
LAYAKITQSLDVSAMHLDVQKCFVEQEISGKTYCCRPKYLSLEVYLKNKKKKKEE